MNFTPGFRIRYITRITCILFAFVIFFAGKCNRGFRKIAEEKARKDAAANITKNLINTIKGIKYTEVSRKFNNGMTFSPVGYQLTPEWKISFPSGDSVNIYSPKKGRFLNAPVVFDHDSVFSVAWAWLKLKYLTKDSLKFQVLHVHDNVVAEEKTQVFMSFYSNDYIKNVLHSDTNILWKPSRRDTAYIRAKTEMANKVLDSAFAGTDPVKLTSKISLVTVKKKATPEEVDGGKSYDAYLEPTYDVVVNNAYDNFSYSFTCFVDQHGKIIFRKNLLMMMPEFKESTIATLKVITDGYLNKYLTVTPAKTLGMAHTSIIFVNITGIKRK